MIFEWRANSLGALYTMDHFNLLGRAVAHSFGGSFYNFDTYSAVTCGRCFVRAYNIGGRLAIIALVNLNVLEIDHNQCADIMWRILFRAEGYRAAIHMLLPQPIAEEINEHIILPVNIVYEEFYRAV
jgi:hypothetical protein